MQKEKERFSKEKAAEYYLKSKEAIEEKSREPKTCHKKKKTRLKSTKKMYQELVQYKKEELKNQ